MKSLVRTFNSKKICPAIGPFSSATLIDYKDFTIVHTSGIIALDKVTGEINSSFTTEQATLALHYLVELIEELGGSIKSIAKVNIYLTDMDDFQYVNEVYSSFFTDHYPSRACVQVSRLPKNAKFEIEATAYIESKRLIKF